MNIKISLPLRAFLLASLLLLQACSGTEDSPEAQVRAFVDAGVEAGEARSTSDIRELLHRDYADQRGNNAEQLTKLLRAYFFRHKNIHLFSRIDTIEILDDNRASVVLHVAMAGTVISDVEALAGLRAEVYRFELQLEREETWQLRHASWAPASLAVFE